MHEQYDSRYPYQVDQPTPKKPGFRVAINTPQGPCIYRMAAAPRAGEGVEIDSMVYVVAAVTWTPSSRDQDVLVMVR